MADFGGKANTTIDGTNNLTYGIDAQGKMYIYNLGTNKMVFYGDPGKGFANVYVMQNEGNRFKFEGDQRKNAPAPAPAAAPASNTAISTGGGGYVAPVKKLDTAALQSLDAQIAGYDTVRANAKQKATLKRDASLKEKEEEMKREKGKYEGSKLSTLQDFGGAVNDTNINTRNTLENLVSSLSTLGLGGGRALTRQILDAANMANRKANATQATNNRNLDSAFNEYTAGNENDVKKIRDQFGYDAGEADREYYQNRQNALYKKADVYNAVDDTGSRERLMNEGNSLTSLINGSTFLNPSYTGATRAMATADVGDYNQDIARYDTTGIGTTGEGGQAAPGNLAIKAIAVNDKDLGIKKKTENELGYGV